MAIIAGVESAVRIHIERGDDLNARDAGGQTPLILAAARNKPHIVKLLLDAGADPLLADSDGKTALHVANSADAREIVSMLEPSFCRSLEAAPCKHGTPSSDEAPANDKPISVAYCGRGEVPLLAAIPNLFTAEQDLPKFTESAATLATDHNKDNGGSYSPTVTTIDLFDFDEDGALLDLSGWEAEAELTTPDGDPTVLATASDIQNAISEHAPIDLSADWDDFEAYLPERALPLPKADDAEAHERLRTLLLRAIREASVPDDTIVVLTQNDDRSPNEEAGAMLRMVINDLGAETDERHEYSTYCDDFTVHVEPRETPDEEQAVDDALAHIDDLESRRNDPIRLYLRAFQNDALLTADEEVALGKAMEQGIEAALDALAGSLSGINAVVDAALWVKDKTKPLRWMSLGTRDEGQEVGADQSGPSTATGDVADDSEGDNDSQDDSEDASPDNELSDFIANAERLRQVAQKLQTHASANNKAAREALGALGLSGTYLLHLFDSGQIIENGSADAFRKAMLAYRTSRDRMAVANLKLVLSIAKKYLYSGIPLDDLIQEGNLGLLKGVERFDWRRGFKFSTYATWWIRQQVSRHVADSGRTIRVPVHIIEKLQRIDHAARDFIKNNGRPASISELAELVELSPRKVAAYMQITGEPLPIHELDIDSMIAADARDDYISPDPLELVAERDMSKVVHKILGTLKLKDESILRMRFGIGVSDAMTLDEIGTRMGLTRERIRQIETKAIRHLKHPGRLDALMTALNGPNPPARPNCNEDDDESSSRDSLDDAQVEKLADAVSTKPPRKSARKPLPVPVDIPTLDADPTESDALPNSVSAPVQRLLDAAAVLGALVRVDRKGADNSIWIDFSKAPTTPPRPLIRKLVDSGFKFWPGKGYWR